MSERPAPPASPAGTGLSATQGAPEEELPVEVGHIDRVHVNHVDVAKPRQRQVFEQLAAQAASTHDQHAATEEARGRGGGRQHDEAQLAAVGGGQDEADPLLLAR